MFLQSRDGENVKLEGRIQNLILIKGRIGIQCEFLPQTYRKTKTNLYFDFLHRLR